MADDPIEVMAKRLLKINPGLDILLDDVIAILSALESAGYVIGRIRWVEKSGGGGLFWFGNSYMGEVEQWGGDDKPFVALTSNGFIGDFNTYAEGREAVEASVRKAMREEP